MIESMMLLSEAILQSVTLLSETTKFSWQPIDMCFLFLSFDFNCRIIFKKLLIYDF
jgi:hypothetical protein